ncbi:Z385C protein, partial [Sula dactylatra]|nr:Z385C protein [Sula dactylatra]
HNPENGVRLVEAASCPPSQPEQRMKREKKHQSFTLCEVCNIQLNSAAQAQIHYNGKSHQKRLKQLNKGKMPAAQAPGPPTRCGSAPSLGPSGHTSPLLASLPIPGRPLHPPLDIKHFLTFRLNGTSPLNLFPNFNTVSPRGRAGIGCQTPAPAQQSLFYPAPLLESRPATSGLITGNQAEAHYKGHKHARRLKAIEAMKNKQKAAGAAAAAAGHDGAADFAPSPESSEEPGSTGTRAGIAPLGSPLASELSEGTSDATSMASSATPAAEAQAADSGSSVSSAPETEKEGKKSKPHLYCPTCKVTVNSLSQLEAHNTGAKHKSMLEGHSTQMRRGRGKLLSRAGHKSKRIGNKGSINIQNKAFHCQVCEIYVNSETQLKQHMSSRRHKDRLAGKPPKPKYSPYNKLQKNAALASKLALQKHLTKTLATRFLPSPLTAAAVCAMPGPLALRPAAATTLFQAPILGPALFRTPPAHVRTTPGPIVFAPY